MRKGSEAYLGVGNQSYLTVLLGHHHLVWNARISAHGGEIEQL